MADDAMSEANGKAPRRRFTPEERAANKQAALNAREEKARAALERVKAEREFQVGAMEQSACDVLTKLHEYAAAIGMNELAANALEALRKLDTPKNPK